MLSRLVAHGGPGWWQNWPASGSFAISVNYSFPQSPVGQATIEIEDSGDG
jgi:hypothetical protein